MHQENYATLEDLFPWIAFDDDPISVLIVEDDALMQAQFTSLIRALDFEVEIRRVSTAEEAEDLLSDETNNHFDLIIADQFLEGTKTGLDLWRYCKAHCPEIRFILTSGEQLKNYLNQFAPSQGRPDFLGKPFTVQEASQKFERSLKEVNGNKIWSTIEKRDNEPTPMPITIHPTSRFSSREVQLLLFALAIGLLALYAHVTGVWD